MIENHREVRVLQPMNSEATYNIMGMGRSFRRHSQASSIKLRMIVVGSFSIY